VLDQKMVYVGKRGCMCRGMMMEGDGVAAVEECERSGVYSSGQEHASSSPRRVGETVAQEDTGIDVQQQEEEQQQQQRRGAVTSINHVKFQLKFLIPNALSGCIIGKNGSNLARIYAESGAFIQANAPGYAVQSARDRFIIIAGDSVQQCVHGLELLLMSIKEADKAGFLKKSEDERMYLKQIIPGVCAGNIIGLRGMNVARLGVEKGVSIVVEPKPENVGVVPFRIVSYAGPSLDHLIDGVRGVVDMIKSDEQYMREIRGIKSIVFKVVEVDTSRVGALIGPKGRNLQALQEVLKCKLTIWKSEKDESVHYVSIWGQPDNVRAAVRVAMLHAKPLNGKKMDE
jgi:predicted RNA-binding protein Jag